jgi:hypothetical protein
MWFERLARYARNQRLRPLSNRGAGGAPRLYSRGPFGFFGETRRSMSSFAKASEDTRSHSSTASQLWLPASASERGRCFEPSRSFGQEQPRDSARATAHRRAGGPCVNARPIGDIGSRSRGKSCFVHSIEQVISLKAHPLFFVTRHA